MLRDYNCSDMDVKQLDLSANNIRLANIRFPVGLDSLVLNGNKIQNYAQHQLPSNLVFLHLDNTGMRYELLKQIIFPPDLHTLVLSHNLIDSVSNIIFPSKLQVLNLNFNNIQVLKDIQLPSSLDTLFIEHNKLENNRFHRMSIKFPDSLKILKLSHNNIHSFSGMSLPKTLARLYLDNNGITNRMLIFMSMSLPKDLFILSLKNNKITSLFTVQLLLKRAVQWNLSGNNITKDESLSYNPFMGHNMAWDQC